MSWSPLPQKAEPPYQVHHQLQCDDRLARRLKARRNQVKPIQALAFAELPFNGIAFCGVLPFHPCLFRPFYLRRASQRRTAQKTEMVVHLTNGDGTISSLLTNEAAMTRAVNGIMGEARLYQGVNLDFEGLGYRDDGEQLKAVQDGFTKFVRLLDRAGEGC